MNSPQQLSIKDFTYALPDERIAKYPLPVRDESKLLIYRQGNIQTNRYKHLDTYLPEGTLLVFNNTKVVEARILFKKFTGSTIELFCLEPADIYPDITTAMLQKKKALWKCLVGGAKKWKEDNLARTIEHHGKNITLTASKKEKLTDCFLIEFGWGDELLSFAEILHIAGLLPLPPYLNRVADATDNDRYQTIYAQNDGSVAAPTAGLHFTDNLFKKFYDKHIEHIFTTLHVGAGTFKPVKSELMAEHEMHAEFIEISIELIEKLIHKKSDKIIAVGTTSLRTIESLFWIGVKVLQDNTITPDKLHLQQWEAYNIEIDGITMEQSLSALHCWMTLKNINRFVTTTKIIIAPGYMLKVADGLITNFHQPQSTLLLLVAAIVGNDWKTMYQYALDNDFRFLSYGDGCLLS